MEANGVLLNKYHVHKSIPSREFTSEPKYIRSDWNPHIHYSNLAIAIEIANNLTASVNRSCRRLESWLQPFSYRIKRTATWDGTTDGWVRTGDKVAKVTNLQGILVEQQPPPNTTEEIRQALDRQPRGVLTSLALFAAGSMLTGVIASLFGTPSSYDTNHAIAEIIKANQEQVRALAFNRWTLENDEFDAAVFRLLTQFELGHHANVATLDKIQSSLASLQRQELSLGAVSQDNLIDIFMAAKEVADKEGYSIPFKTAAGLMEIPCQSAINATHLTVHVFVPFVQADYTLYKAHPVPLVLHDHTGRPILMTIRTSPSLIAVDTDSYNTITPTSEDLETCLHVGQHRICTAPLVERAHTSCLACLFFGKSDCVQKACQVVHLTAPYSVQAVGSDKYAISVLEHTTVNVECMDRRPPQGLELQPGTTELHLRPGCTAKSELFSVHAPLQRLAQPIHTASLTWDIRGNVLNNMTNAELHSQSPYLLKATGHLATAVHHLDAARTSGNYAIIAGAVGAALGVALTIAVVCYCQGRCPATPPCGGQLGPTPTPTAPAAIAPIVLEMQKISAPPMPQNNWRGQ